MVSPEYCVKLVQSESEQLKQYLDTLPPDAWSRPSACDRWEVRDVVAHLIGGAQIYAGAVSRGLQGDLSPPEGFPDADTFNAASASEPIARMAISAREKLGDQLLSTFNATTDELSQLLAGLGPSDLDKGCYHPGGTVQVRSFMNLRVFELAMHGWDIRSRLEPSAHLSAESLPILIDMVPGLLGWAFRPGPRLPSPVRYRFELTGTGASNSDIVVEGDKAYMESAVAAPANVTFHCDTETFMLLMFGRLAVDAAISAGRLAVEGDNELVAEFERWFKGA